MPAIFYVSQVTLWMLVVVQGVLLLLVYRHFGLMALGTVEGVQRDGLPIGTPAPAIEGVTLQEKQLVWEPTPGRMQLLAFVSPDCGPCVRIVPHITALQVDDRNLDIILIVAGTKGRLTRLVDTFQPPPSFLCLAEEESSTVHPYKVRVTPFVFLIGEDGRILSKGLCDTPARLRRILAAGGLERVVVSDDVMAESSPVLH